MGAGRMNLGHGCLPGSSLCCAAGSRRNRLMTPPQKPFPDCPKCSNQNSQIQRDVVPPRRRFLVHEYHHHAVEDVEPYVTASWRLKYIGAGRIWGKRRLCQFKGRPHTQWKIQSAFDYGPRAGRVGKKASWSYRAVCVPSSACSSAIFFLPFSFPGFNSTEYV